MIHAASSMNVVDTSSGKRLLGMRFQGLGAALEYLAQASLMCSDCGRRFSARSTVTMMNRSDTWEIMFPHDCRPKLDSPQQKRAAITDHPPEQPSTGSLESPQ